MFRRFAGLNGLAIVTALSLLATTGCQQNQQMQTVSMGNWGRWNLFGAGSHTRNFNLQYPVGDTQVINPAAAGTINTHTRSNSYSQTRNLQYPIGPTQQVRKTSGRSWPNWGRSKPKAQPAPRYTNSDAGATTYTKNFNLQYAIGPAQGVNGHRVAAGRSSSSYSRKYKLQYPIGRSQSVSGHGNRGFSHRRSTRPTYARRSSGHTRMRSTGRAGGSYVVQPGDTLMDIARAHYGPTNARRWQDILNANRHVITRADQIKPGMRLNIP